MDREMIWRRGVSSWLVDRRVEAMEGRKDEATWIIEELVGKGSRCKVRRWLRDD